MNSYSPWLSLRTYCHKYMSAFRRTTLLFAAFLLWFCAGAAFYSVSLAQSKLSASNGPVEDARTFTDHVIGIADREFPQLKLKKTERPLLVSLADSGKLSLENLYREIKQDPETSKEDEKIKRFLKSVTEIHPGSSQQPIPAWDAVKTRLRPQIFPARYLNQTKKAIVCRSLPFSRKLMEGFVIDSQNTFQYVTDVHLKAWHVEIDQLSAVAYDNLSRASQDLKLCVEDNARGKSLILSMKDGYDAARLLLPDVQRRLHKELGNPCFVAIPNRDYLIAWSSDSNRKENMDDEIRKDFQTKHHPLTPAILKLDDLKITSKTAPEEHFGGKRRKHRLRRARTKPAGTEVPAGNSSPANGAPQFDGAMPAETDGQSH